MMKSVQDIDSYQRSKKLFPQLVQLVNLFPREALYLKDQMNRAANSIHANIAEGFGRSEAEFKRYLTVSLGSNNELLSHLEDAHSLGYLSKETYDSFFESYTVVGKLLYRLREKWKSDF